jgi:hypothetical protein
MSVSPRRLLLCKRVPRPPVACGVSADGDHCGGVIGLYVPEIYVWLPRSFGLVK